MQAFEVYPVTGRLGCPNTSLRAVCRVVVCYTSREKSPQQQRQSAALRLEWFTLKMRSSFVRAVCRRAAAQQVAGGILIALATLGLASCGQRLYKFPTNNFANRPIPPSKLAQRVLVAIDINGGGGALQILDGLRDIRNNIQNTQPTFGVGGFSAGSPTVILNYPEQIRGYVYSNTTGSVTSINYGTESASGNAVTLAPNSPSIAIPADGSRYFGAEEVPGQFAVVDNPTARSFAIDLPNIYKVAANEGGTVVLAMVRNSNRLYRLIKLNQGSLAPPGAIDCQPNISPVFCAVPVPGDFDRPVTAFFSSDGTSAFILNCGPECGGTTASVSVVNLGGLTIDVIPTSLPYPNPVAANVAIPGGATAALTDGTTLYLAGQQRQPDGLFAGRLTTVNLPSLTVTGSYAISDGNHSKMLFADDNTLWIGSQLCATGERHASGQNYNCLTRFDIGAKTATIVPAVDPTNAASKVPYPNADNNLVYYGSLTGLCWVQTFHKVYTAYGGQVHAFRTTDGSEINNQFISVQGNALDVAYMDAITNSAN